MIIDVHTYVGKSLFGEESTPEELLQIMEKNGIEKSVICPVKTTDAYFEEQNKYIADLVKEYPDKFLGFARIDPYLGIYSHGLLEKCLSEYGMKGVLLNPWEEHFAINDKIVDPIAEICKKWKVPMMVETGYPWMSHCFQVGDLAERHPDLTIIMTHGGQMDSSGYALTDIDFVMNRHENLIVETSGNFSDEGIENMPVRLGSHRMVFGTHYPYLNTELEIYRIKRAHLDEKIREDIFYNNAKKLLRIEE